MAIFAVAIVSLTGTIEWYERPIPSMLVDPDGVVSNIGLPHWEAAEKGLRYPDRIIAVDGHPVLPAPGRTAGEQVSEWVEQAARRGGATVDVSVAMEEGLRTVTLPLHALDPLAWWLFGGSLLLVGMMYVGVGVIAVSARPMGKLARTFSAHAMLVGLFLITLFDFHTSRRLAPLFCAAFALVPVTGFVLPLRLPSDVAWIARRGWLEPLLMSIGGSLGLVMAVVQGCGGSTLQLRRLASLLFAASLVFFVGCFVVRFLRATGRDREVLRVLLVSLVPALAILGLAFILTVLSMPGSNAAFAFAPFLALVPFSTLVAFIRHDLWGSRALLSRTLTRIVITVVASILAIALGAGIAALLGVPLSQGFLAAAISGAVASVAVLFLLGVGDQKIFSSRAEYKPTIEQLSEELALTTSPEQVVEAIERTVYRWLPCRHVHFLTTSRMLGGLEGDEQSKQSTSQGEHPRSPGPVVLSIPVRVRDDALGLLQVGAKHGGALYTTEDLDLLKTIANLAGLAFAQAEQYAELERRRRNEAHAWRGERAAIIETVAAEIAHEVRYPINFFRSIFTRGSTGEQLDAEEVDIGCEEVERLERLVFGLRRVSVRKLERRTASLRVLVSHAEALLRDRLQERRFVVDVADDARVRCDSDQVVQVLVNLIANALDAISSSEALGVRWTRTAQGGRLEVWDEGPGFASDPSKVFSPWYSTKRHGTGLGLAITHRIVRAHGWTIDAGRVEKQTAFAIGIPASDLAAVEVPATKEEVA